MATAGAVGSVAESLLAATGPEPLGSGLKDFGMSGFGVQGLGLGV